MAIVVMSALISCCLFVSLAIGTNDEIEIKVNDDLGCDRGIIICPLCGAYGIEMCTGTLLTTVSGPQHEYQQYVHHDTYYNYYYTLKYCLTCSYRSNTDHNHVQLCRVNCGFSVYKCPY